MSLDDLRTLKEEAQAYPIITPEIQMVSEYVERAEKWIQKVVECREK
jgi:hypothetical protein